MERRDLLRGLAGAAGLLAFGAGAAGAAEMADPVYAAFEAARATTPWTLGYVGLEADVDEMPLTLKGRLPAGLAGSFLRNGPARHALGGLRYHHWFDGDGMVQEYRIAEGRIVHRGRFVRTAKFLADSAAGRPVREAFDTRPPGAEPVRSADAINVANTSVVRHGGELLALWEGGSATRLDERTLETRGVKTWSADYAGMPFSAHPKVEPDGTLWNFGISSMAGMLSVYRVRPSGELAQAATLPVPRIAMVHDFAVTERHLVFLLPPFVFDGERMKNGATFLGSHVWQPGLGLRVLVLPKDALDKPVWAELPAGFVFHVGNAWEDAAGTIRMDFMRAPDAFNATTGIEQIMRGRFTPRDFTTLALLEIDTRSGRARQTVMPQRAEFPRVDPRVVGRRYRSVYACERVAAPDDRPGYDAVMRFDVERGHAERYVYGPEVMAEEHLFVPRPGSAREGEGWVVGTALDLARRQMLFSVFDAEHLADGPLAQGTLARPMPLGLHGIFVAA